MSKKRAPTCVSALTDTRRRFAGAFDRLLLRAATLVAPTLTTAPTLPAGRAWAAVIAARAAGAAIATAAFAARAAVTAEAAAVGAIAAVRTVAARGSGRGELLLRRRRQQRLAREADLAGVGLDADHLHLRLVA